jgi:hypothetical protein
MRRQQTNAWSSTVPFATLSSNQEYYLTDGTRFYYIASSGIALVLHLGVEKCHRASESASDMPSCESYAAQCAQCQARHNHVGVTTVERPDSKGFHHTGDSNSCPPDLELGALSN